MKKTQKSRVDSYLEGADYLSPKLSEPYFSWEPCECCGSTLGGNRYKFSGIIADTENEQINESYTFSCCTDCFDYLFMNF